MFLPDLRRCDAAKRRRLAYLMKDFALNLGVYRVTRTTAINIPLRKQWEYVYQNPYLSTFEKGLVKLSNKAFEKFHAQRAFHLECLQVKMVI